MKINLTDEQIERRLDWVEQMIAAAHPKDLPYLNDTFQKLIDEQVRRDLARGFMVGESVTGEPSDAPLAAAILAEQQFKRPSQR